MFKESKANYVQEVNVTWVNTVDANVLIIQKPCH